MGNENRWQIELLRRVGVYTFFREWEDPSWPSIVCFALGLHQRQTGIAGNELVGPARPCPCPGALCEGWTGSPTVDLRGQLIYRYSRLQLRWFPRHRSAVLQGGQQVSSTILMYTEKRGRGTILVAIESIPVFEQWQSRTLCARSELRNQFSFFVENVRFAIFHPKLALPPSPRFEMRYV